MPDTVVLHATVDAELDRKLAAMAAEHGISKDELVGDVLRQYVDVDPAHLAFVEEGLRDLDEGRSVSHADVVAAFERRFGPAG